MITMYFVSLLAKQHAVSKCEKDSISVVTICQILYVGRVSVLFYYFYWLRFVDNNV